MFCLSGAVWKWGWRLCCGQQGAACSTCLCPSALTSSLTGRCGWPAATAGTCRRSHTGSEFFTCSLCLPVCSTHHLSHLSEHAGVLQILLVRRFSGPWVQAAGTSVACRWHQLTPGQYKHLLYIKIIYSFKRKRQRNFLRPEEVKLSNYHNRLEIRENSKI